MRAIERLTENKIQTITAPGYYADGGGLYLQITKGSTRSWVLRFRFGGRTREGGLGSLLDVGLTAARKKAGEYRAMIAQGTDPIEQARTVRAARLPQGREKSAPIFEDYAETCIDGWAPDWKNPKHEVGWRSSLRLYAYPTIGRLPVDEIETPHILQILRPIWRDKPETAGRVRLRIERVLAAASVEGLRTGNPAVWKGHLAQAQGLGKRPAPRPMPSLPYTELPAFMVKLRAVDTVAARALELLTLTGTRSGETRGSRWPEFDLAEKIWTIPGVRTKSGRPHVVPLTDRALAILDEMKPLRDLDGQFVFPGKRSGNTLSDMTMSKLVKSLGYSCVPHGFRATFKTWAEQETKHDNVVIEAALSHVVGDAVERAYFRGDYLAKRRALMAEWNTFCTTPPADSSHDRTCSRRNPRRGGLPSDSAGAFRRTRIDARGLGRACGLWAGPCRQDACAIPVEDDRPAVVRYLERRPRDETRRRRGSRGHAGARKAARCEPAPSPGAG